VGFFNLKFQISENKFLVRRLRREKIRFIFISISISFLKHQEKKKMQKIHYHALHISPSFVLWTRMCALAVVGYRDFNDYNLLNRESLLFLQEIQKTHGVSINTIISGGCKGVDTLAERFAKEHSLKMNVLQPRWDLYPRDRYGYKAFATRDRDIAQKSDFMIAFPNYSKGKGTQITIQFAQENYGKTEANGKLKIYPV
jgi:YspA, cpYpsA-related SLOG family